MRIDLLDYSLPFHQIAQEPAEPRDSARMLVSLGEGDLRHRIAADLPDLLRAGDLLVVNETRVIPARLRLHKESGGLVEVLLLEPNGDTDSGTEPSGRAWEAMVKPSARVPVGTTLCAADGRPAVVVGERLHGGLRRVEVLAADIASIGVMPLPPYIRAPLADPERYQTVYATRPGSAAAPTAGLHLTDDVIERCRVGGIAMARVDLGIGLDTFRPITVEDTDAHVMHTERYAVPEETMAACEETRARGGRVVAVGTTAVRALESAASCGALAGRTGLFITDEHRWRVVDLLLTNFHMPRTSLLVLVQAFCGPRWRSLYDIALADGYRFLSFGDAMLLGRAGHIGEPVTGSP